LPEIVVIGGGGHAKVLISVLKKAGWKVLGYTDSENRGSLLAVEYVGDDTVLLELLTGHPGLQAALGVGKIDASVGRLRLQRFAEDLGLVLPVVVSPSAVINEEVAFGPGTVVFDGAVVNSGAATGSCCILNTNCVLEHDCRLGDNVHLAPGATVSGTVTIGDNCMIGAGATVIQGVSICAGCLIGIGSTVVRDITMPGTYVGSPGRRIK
jgi:sugar O-acyltransferase (sialic acid O-acetyltransferase NeuD family)